MNKKLKELLNRKLSKWGNVSVKTFEKDIALLVDVIKEQQKEILLYKNAFQNLDALCDSHRYGLLENMSAEYLCDEVVKTISNTEQGLEKISG